MSIFKDAGLLLLGTRLKRLSEKFFNDVSQIYKYEGIQFEPSWFPIFYLLDQHGGMTFSELAQQLEITQPGVSQMVAALEKRGLVCTEKNTEDRRVRSVILSAEGTELLTTIKPVWQALAESMKELVAEGEHSCRLLTAFDELEEAIAGESIHARVAERLSRLNLMKQTKAASYAPRHDNELKKLLLSCIAQGGPVAEDCLWINDPAAAVSAGSAIIYVAEGVNEIEGALVAVIDKTAALARLQLLLQEKRSQEFIRLLLEPVMARLRSRAVAVVSVAIDMQDREMIGLMEHFDFSLNRVEKDATGERLFTILTQTIDGETV